MLTDNDDNDDDYDDIMEICQGRRRHPWAEGYVCLSGQPAVPRGRFWSRWWPQWAEFVSVDSG